MAEWLTTLDLTGLHLDLLGRLFLAALLGGLVGLEREWSGKPAGFRTNLLICMGAALLTDLSLSVALLADPGMAADPARIAAQIVSGVGFLGAGTIIQSRGSVTGLTTAATLWVVAAIGMAVGAGEYAEAIGATLLVMIALLVLARLEPYLNRHVDQTIRVTVGRDGGAQDRVEAVLGEKLSYEVLEMDRTGTDRLSLAYRVTGPRRHWESLMGRLAELDGVDHASKG
ncbi:MAG: MgtC/SapB family protein [Longimicrobiales bacterium]